MAVKQGWQGRVYEDFEVGDVYPHPLGRTVTQNDNIMFTLMTGKVKQLDLVRRLLSSVPGRIRRLRLAARRGE